MLIFHARVSYTECGKEWKNNIKNNINIINNMYKIISLMEESETTAPNNKDFQFTQQQTTLLFVLHIQHSTITALLNSLYDIQKKLTKNEQLKKKTLWASY